MIVCPPLGICQARKPKASADLSCRTSRPLPSPIVYLPTLHHETTHFPSQALLVAQLF